MSKENKLVPIPGPKVLYENRYCNQNGFSILICGGRDNDYILTNEVLELEIPSLKLKKFPSMVEPHCYLNLVNIKSDVIAIGNRTEIDESLDDSVKFVEIYSDKTKTWTHSYIKTEENARYCVGSFMGKLYLIGGWANSSKKNVSSCYTYDINKNKWNKIADLNVARDFAACTVFEGNIVVTGGKNNRLLFKSVEAYGFYENK